MKYQITINTKSKVNPYNLITDSLDAFLDVINKSQILWIDNMSKGVWLPPSEIVEIVFSRLQDDIAICDANIPSENINDAITHQQQTIEGSYVDPS
jgi:hypothetical protein